MPVVLETICEHAVKNKKDVCYMVFNTRYNDIAHFKKSIPEGERPLDKKYTDNEARKEFLEYMQANFPDIKLTRVFDYVNIGYLEYPYLGSIAVDCTMGDEVHSALVAKYDDENGDPKSSSAALWTMSQDVAIAHFQKRKELFEECF